MNDKIREQQIVTYCNYEAIVYHMRKKGLQQQSIGFNKLALANAASAKAH